MNPRLITLAADDFRLTIPTNKIPVIALNNDVHDSHDRLAMAINALRCGCPAVQIMLHHVSIVKDNGRQEFREIQRVLRILAYHSEEFKAVHPPERQEIVIITRSEPTQS